MELNLLNIASYILALLFIAFLAKSLSWKMIKNTWQMAKNKVLIKEKTTKAIADGKRAFYFENGNTVIYAKTHPKALYYFQEMKKKRRAALQADAKAAAKKTQPLKKV